jgi:hypothetical protein
MAVVQVGTSGPFFLPAAQATAVVAAGRGRTMTLRDFLRLL